MAKKFNRYVIDSSGNEKFPEPVVIHTKVPRFIASVKLMTSGDFKAFEAEVSQLPMGDCLYSARELYSGKMLVLHVLEFWDTDSDEKEIKLSVKLALRAYYTRLLGEVRKYGVNADELNDCLQFVNSNVINSEQKYHAEHFNYSEELRQTYRDNLKVLKWIRKYLRQLFEISSERAGRM